MDCWLCGKKDMEIETCCVSSDMCFDIEASDDDPNKWVSFQGYIERSACCHETLGEGYGDADYYLTKEEANKQTEFWKQYIGKWLGDKEYDEVIAKRSRS